MTLKKTRSSAWIDIVNRYVDSVRFGVIQIVIHNGDVVQVERTEKIRFDKPQDVAVSTASAETKK
jgi:hypothetical protein